MLPLVIRIADRQKVLKHHPDKKKAKGIALAKGEDYFTCITKVSYTSCFHLPNVDGCFIYFGLWLF